MSLLRQSFRGLRPFAVRRNYSSYKSPYGPTYKFQPNIWGLDATSAARLGYTTAMFGVVAGTFALVFFAEVPRVSKDIMQRIPILGDYFVKEVAPEDNPF